MSNEADYNEITPKIEFVEENKDEEENLRQPVPDSPYHLTPCIICNKSVATHECVILKNQKVRLVLTAAVVSENIGLSTAEATISERRNRMCTRHLDSVYEMMCSATCATHAENVLTAPTDIITECSLIYRMLATGIDNVTFDTQYHRGSFISSLKSYFHNYLDGRKRRERIRQEIENRTKRNNGATKRILTESDKNTLSTTLRNVLKESNMELNMDDQKELLDGLGVPEWMSKLEPKGKRGRRNSEITSASRAVTSTPELEICESEPPKVAKRPTTSISRAPTSEPNISKPDPPVFKWKESVLSRLKEKQSQMEIKVECREVPQTEKVILNPEESVLAKLKRKRMEMEMRSKEPKKEPKEEPNW